MYCEIEELRKSLKEDVLDSIIGNEYIEDEALKEKKIIALIQEAIEDADGEIDGYLNKRYPVPLSSVPRVINKFSKDIALYNLFSRQGIEEGTREENYLTRYKAAVKFLENVAKGLIDIGTGNTDGAVVSTPTTYFKTHSSQRLFDRNTLKGM